MGRSRASVESRYRTRGGRDIEVFLGPPAHPVAGATETGPAAPGPQAFLVTCSGDQPLPPHFHRVDQFQVVVGGEGRFGRKTLAPGAFHYTDAYTPYGPIVPSDAGLCFFTLRPQADWGSHPMPKEREEMRRRAGRPGRTYYGGVEPREEGQLGGLAELDQRDALRRTDDGIWGVSYSIPGGAQLHGPDPSAGGGQYYLVLSGSVIVEGATYEGIACLYVDAGRPPVVFTAQDRGAEVLLLQFPRQGVRREKTRA